MIRIVEDAHCRYLSFALTGDDAGLVCRTTLVRPGKAAAGIPELAQSLGIGISDIARVRQVHSTGIREVRPGEPGIEVPVESDGILVTGPGVFGVVRTADCVPVVLVHPGKKAVAVVHAGWKGTCSRITGRAVARLLEITAGDPGDLKAFAGPCIHACCYEVGTEVRDEFARAGHDIDRLMEGRNLDLVKANLQQAVELGVRDISSSGFCTLCHPDLFYSYRRNGTEQRILTLAGYHAWRPRPERP